MGAKYFFLLFDLFYESVKYVAYCIYLILKDGKELG